MEPVTDTSPPQSDVQSTLTHAKVLVRNVKSPARKEERRQGLCEIFQEDPDLPDDCLEENERGEMNVVQFEIHTGDAPPQSSDLAGCLLQSERKCHTSFTRCKKPVSSSPPVTHGLVLLCCVVQCCAKDKCCDQTRHLSVASICSTSLGLHSTSQLLI